MTDVGRCFQPAPPMNRAAFHRLGLAVGIAIALSGCHLPSAAERAANERRGDAEYAEERAQEAYDATYDRCIYRVTGPFAAASIEVMHECEKLAASGTSAGTAETEGLRAKPAGPVGNAETPHLNSPSGASHD